MRIFRCLTLLALLAACNQPSGSAHFVGSYLLDRGRARDTLLLLADGRYRHTTAIEAHALLSDSGTWRVTVVEGQPRLQLNQWVLWSVTDSGQQQLAADAGTWYARVDTLPDGSIALPLGGDQPGAFVAIR
jgi:hypothetical protein